MERHIVDDLEALIGVLPPRIQTPLREREDLQELLEVVLDMGRPPEARFLGTEAILSPKEIREQDSKRTNAQATLINTSPMIGTMHTVDPGSG